MIIACLHTAPAIAMIVAVFLVGAIIVPSPMDRP